MDRLQLANQLWFCTLVRFVGAIAGNGILAMDPAKVSAIDAWNRPTTGTEIRSFLGIVKCPSESQLSRESATTLRHEVRPTSGASLVSPPTPT